MISLVRRWLPDREIKLMGDTAYSVLELGLHANTRAVTLITTGRLDAVLHEPPPERHPHTIGRPRVVGKRLPSLEQVLQDPHTVWQNLTLDWYGEGKRTVEVCTGTALWYRYGLDPLPIRWVLTRDPSGKHPPKAIFSTDLTQTAEQIIRDFMKRWSLEVTFEECRAHLGIETQRQWSDRAIERSTPLLFGLYSLVALGWRGHCILMAAFLSHNPLGIVSRPPHSMTFLLSSGDICGAMRLFPHQLLILMWF